MEKLMSYHDPTYKLDKITRVNKGYKVYKKRHSLKASVQKCDC